MSVGRDYLAQNSSWTGAFSKNKLLEWDINIYYSWSNSGVKNTYDIYSVFLHGRGHTMGLDHSPVKNGVMYLTIPIAKEKSFTFRR